MPANVQTALKKADDGIARILAIPDPQRTFENTVRALDDVVDDLNTATSTTRFMQEVSPDMAMRDGSRAAEDALNDWGVAIGENEAVYRALKAVPTAGLDPVQKRLLDFYLRDYRRGGMALPPDKRTRLAEIERAINKNQQAFAKDIADDEGVVTYTAKELAGVPASRLATFPRSGDLYLMRVGETNLPAITGFAKDPATREKHHFAYSGAEPPTSPS